MENRQRPRVLCVDDEPAVLEGLSLILGRRYDVVTATSGTAGLELLEKDRAIWAVLSDMQMPRMNGATFLARARELVPDTVRLLLTGHSDVSSAISAVNDGQIFRFLTKPCPPAMLVAAIDAAVEQHRLITAEKVLLEQTLRGSVKALTEVLALTSPVSFGRANRVKHLVTELADALALPERWQVEVAAMLSQIGSIVVPAETIERAYESKPLTDSEQKMMARIPVVTEHLLGNIPRLELVRDILSTYPQAFKRAPPDNARAAQVQQAAQILKVAIDFDVLESQGNPAPMSVDTLRGRTGVYMPEVLDALARVRSGGSVGDEIREVPVSALRSGMVIAQDVKLISGSLLVTRGYEITVSFLERVRNFSPGLVVEPVRVIVRATPKTAG